MFDPCGRPLQRRLEIDDPLVAGRERRTSGLQPGVEHPGRTATIEPRAIGDEGRLVHMARDHHRRLMPLDPLHQFDVAEKPLSPQLVGEFAGGA